MWETVPTTLLLTLSGALRGYKDHVQPSIKLNTWKTIPMTQNKMPTLCQQAYYWTGSLLELLHCMISLTDYQLQHRVGQV